MWCWLLACTSNSTINCNHNDVVKQPTYDSFSTILGVLQVLSLMEHLAFCRDNYLPVNDVWLFARSKAAAGAAAALDDAANAALPTAVALEALDAVAAEFPNDSIKIQGTYPHAIWQGSRIEGFVVSQGCQVLYTLTCFSPFASYRIQFSFKSCAAYMKIHNNPEFG